MSGAAVDIIMVVGADQSSHHHYCESDWRARPCGGGTHREAIPKFVGEVGPGNGAEGARQLDDAVRFAANSVERESAVAIVDFCGGAVTPITLALADDFKIAIKGKAVAVHTDVGEIEIADGFTEG